MKVAILGYGEVGKAIAKLTQSKHQVFIKDLDQDNWPKSVDILHVCIPYSDTFENTVITCINTLKVKLTIINSTVKPGTTLSIFKQTQIPIAHAPIDGVHPHLYDYLFTFTKPIGPVNEKSWLLTDKHFSDLGVKTARFDSPLETELAKVMSTTYYGWNIIFQKWVYQLSQNYGANYSQVYEEYNQIYNQGYQKTKPNVVRPILKNSTGPIGGHCVIPNAQIISNLIPNDFTSFLLKQNRKFGLSNPEDETKA